MIPRNAMEAARLFLEPALAQAKCVVDATAGNGHDVLFFCRKIQSYRITKTGGKVFG